MFPYDYANNFLKKKPPQQQHLLMHFYILYNYVILTINLNAL